MLRELWSGIQATLIFLAFIAVVFGLAVLANIYQPLWCVLGPVYLMVAGRVWWMAIGECGR